MARRLLPKRRIMQIPYDLEFVSNRPAARVRTASLGETFPLARRGKRREPDVFDALLAWLHRLIGRLEKK